MHLFSIIFVANNDMSVFPKGLVQTSCM